MNRFPIPRPTETAAIGRVRPRRPRPIPDLLWTLAGLKVRSDRYGASLVGHLIVRALHETTD